MTDTVKRIGPTVKRIGPTLGYRFGVDDTGMVRCPIPRCGAELVLVRSGSIPIDPAGGEMPFKDAVATSWQVECLEGHVVGVPSGADDNPSFDLGRFLSGRTPDAPDSDEDRCCWCGRIVERRNMMPSRTYNPNTHTLADYHCGSPTCDARDLEMAAR